MNYLLPERLDRLAREYALGTLAGPARRRFERLLRQTPAAMRAVGAWQERLGGLAGAVPPMQPSESVWKGFWRCVCSVQSEHLNGAILFSMNWRVLMSSAVGIILRD